MPSVVGLLEQRELAGRRRVDELREEVDRIQAELIVAEEEWEEWAVAPARGSARMEALRSKAKRLILCGRPAEAAPGRFTLASGVSGSGGGS
ncbi:hypothetical protein OOK36_52435 [Streptomyces sp. NBC_00365]|uniref:hypothetical protein n=1 Tax=Streptomyces sp. NBC_00365 TaxID=2975726 RepID=UPI002259B0E0|nr:hypothetical protein [Streptomyces sp. NBC_00365]MCX5097145.1 hypothetical protein [Streptomyces sp. NBC_00365]